MSYYWRQWLRQKTDQDWLTDRQSQCDFGFELIQLFSSEWTLHKEYYRNGPNKKQNKLRGFSPQAKYNDRATAACRRS
jgi:hypothetical protein